MARLQLSHAVGGAHVALPPEILVAGGLKEHQGVALWPVGNTGPPPPRLVLHPVRGSPQPPQNMQHLLGDWIAAQLSLSNPASFPPLFLQH